MKDIHLYTWRDCPYSKKAKQMLQEQGYAFTDHDITDRPKVKEQLTEITGQTSVPYVFIGDDLIGGSSDLEELINNNQLEERLK